MGSLITPTPTPTLQPGIGAIPTPKKTQAPGMAYVNPDLIPDAPKYFGQIEVPRSNVDPDSIKKTKPVTDFSYVQGQGSNLMAVRFYDESTGNPDAWEWQFGDGQTSSEQNPVNIYPMAGEYHVFLDASNELGRTQKNLEIYVTDRPYRPEAKFKVLPEAGPAPLTVQFIDLSAYGPTKYLWSFGDGTRSELENPVHTYQKEGTYWVSLDVSFVLGKDLETGKPFEASSSYIKQITVTGPVKASFTADPVEGPVPLKVRFTDTSVGNPTEWNWNFGDGKTSTERNPSHTYSVHNTKGYPVKLTITAQGSTDSATSTIKTVASSRPQAFFTASCVPDTPTIGCYFEDRSTNSPTSWFWDFGDGTKSFDQYPVHRYRKEGNYIVTLTAGNPAGMGKYSKDITVKEKKLG
jgi:PKD repeat protein